MKKIVKHFLFIFSYMIVLLFSCLLAYYILIALFSPFMFGKVGLFYGC